jgi:hypothetical protein
VRQLPQISQNHGTIATLAQRRLTGCPEGKVLERRTENVNHVILGIPFD